ncbi:TIGR03546 family protein [Aliikangiella coralliicola]|uniref:TIGR03546 family protein n=1 Tax=Aliikangiella coralliicola TaxID=2592383 RepID=A0A545UG17_9GAMM|nr:TIGR03546 family protein [Aliikangiella coralliicola]TQV88417.1 TIGR03546 family protein [Aliikangiella coralliicola]
MLAILAKILKVLNSEQSPGQLAMAVSLATIVGITPLLSLHNLLILLVVLWFRVNLTIFLVFWPLMTILGLAIAPLAEQLGLQILQAPALVPMWESFYNTLIGRWSNFNYSGVIGALLIAIVLSVVLYPTSKYLINQYRDKWLEKFEQYHIVKVLKASKLWQLYQS